MSRFLSLRFVRAAAFAGLATAFFSTLCAAFAGDVDSIKIAFDRGDHVYSVGEKATFAVSVLDASGAPADSGTATIRVTNDGRDELDVRTFDLSQETIPPMECALDQPGFVKVFAHAESEDGAVAKDGLAGAGFDPEKIEPGLPEPEDFEEFWNKGREEVRAIPIDVRQRKLEEFSNEGRDVFAISFATVGGGRVFGYLGVPKTDAAPYPAIVNVAWAGPGFGPDPKTTDEGFVVLTLNVFPYEVPIDETERRRVYDEYNKTVGGRYCALNMTDRERYFYRAPILGLDRAVDWLAEREFVDPERIGYHGTSQGGGFGLILTGLNKHIRRAVVSVPAICDHAGLLKGRASGWPRLAESPEVERNPEEQAKTLETLRYYDAVNFARRIDVPIVATVGFVDVTCCPSSVYAAYNAIPSSDKQIRPGVFAGHHSDRNYRPAEAEMKAALKAAK